MTEFRSRFIGKVSPVHFFWGAMDLAVTRFSGRTAPPHPGGAPQPRRLGHGRGLLARGVQLRLLARRLGARAAFYSYAYPEPDGLRPVPGAARPRRYSADAGEFLLPYEAVRTADDPDRTLLEFLQSTYEAAAEHGTVGPRRPGRPP